jgi:hypothetical protein
MTDPSHWPVIGYFDSAGKIIGALAGLVALIGGVVALIYQLSPSPPPSRKATLNVQGQPLIRTLRGFLLDSGQSDQIPNYTADELAAVGNYYRLGIAVEGLRNRHTDILWTLDRHTSGPPIDDPKWIHQVLSTFDPPTNSYQFVAKVWIQRPPFSGRFYAILEIDYPANQALSITETPPFIGISPPPRTSTTYHTTTTIVTLPATTSTVSTTTTNGFTTTSTETVAPRTTTIVRTVPRVTTLPSAPSPTPRPQAAITPTP